MVCNDEGELEDGFDPPPYSAEAFERLRQYELVTIQPQTAKWVYEEEEGVDLSFMYLFTSFKHTGGDQTYYAMLTIYINKESQTKEDTFIERLYLEELNATQSSQQGFNVLYDNMLKQVVENERLRYELGDIPYQTILEEMLIQN